MKQCSDYEIELSALYDGESDPAMALRLVEHLVNCKECSAFVRELGTTQRMIDENLAGDHVSPEKQAPVAAIESKRRPGFFTSRPQWAVGLAAILVLTVATWFGVSTNSSSGLTNDLRDGELVIRLEEDKGRMSDERFVALVSELLRADRRYQRQMYVVLDELTQTGDDGETLPSYRSNESEFGDEPAWDEPQSPLTAAKE